MPEPLRLYLDQMLRLDVAKALRNEGHYVIRLQIDPTTSKNAIALSYRFCVCIPQSNLRIIWSSFRQNELNGFSQLDIPAKLQLSGQRPEY